MSESATFELTQDFFTTIQIENVREVSLGGNVDLKAMRENRLKWNDKSRTKVTKQILEPFNKVKVKFVSGLGGLVGL